MVSNTGVEKTTRSSEDCHSRKVGAHLRGQPPLSGAHLKETNVDGSFPFFNEKSII